MVTTPSLTPGRGGPSSTQNSRRTMSTKTSAQLVGLIMWLRPRDGLPDHSELPKGCYNHPVVILSEAPSDTGDVVVLILTSFGETDIHDKFPRKRDRKLRLAYLPIHPSPHPDTTVRLHLKGHAELRCNTYVNTREKHTVPFYILQPYDRKAINTRYALTSDSYQQLAHRAGFVPLPASLPLKVDGGDFATGKGTTTTTAPTTTRPALDAIERDRLLHRPATYGTVTAVSSTPAPSSVSFPSRQGAQAAGHANTPHNRTLTQGYCYTTTPQTTRQVAAAPRPYQTDDTLPLYYRSNTVGAEHDSSSIGGNGDGAGWGDKLASLAKLALGIAVLGTAAYGLWSVGMGGRRRDLV